MSDELQFERWKPNKVLISDDCNHLLIGHNIQGYCTADQSPRFNTLLQDVVWVVDVAIDTMLNAPDR